MLAFLLKVPQMRLAGRITFCVIAQSIVSAGVILVSIPLAHYLTFTDVIGLALVAAALAFISATLLAQGFEFAERFWSGVPDHPAPAAGPSSSAPPFISIHLACANEPPDMVIESVESLLAIDWPAFEVIVVDNNTTDPYARATLAAWMAKRRDPRLRFIQFEHLPGYKAGALNQALAITDPAAQ